MVGRFLFCWLFFRFSLDKSSFQQKKALRLEESLEMQVPGGGYGGVDSTVSKVEIRISCRCAPPNGSEMVGFELMMAQNGTHLQLLLLILSSKLNVFHFFSPYLYKIESDNNDFYSIYERKGRAA